MKQGMKALLTAMVLLTASGGVTQAADYTMDEVVVTGLRDGQVVAAPGGLVNETAKLGILGNQSIMDIPYTEMSMTQKTLQTFDDPSQPLANVLLNNPSIRTSTTSPMYTDFSMRGINMNGNHMMLNGVPSLFYQFNGPSTHYIERIDITSGPNAGVNGVSMSNNGTDSGKTPAPGTINLVTKKAGNTPVTRYTQTFSGRGNFGEFIDVGRRFGKDNEWGIRVMGEYMEGELALKDAEKNEKNIFVNLDRKGKTSNTNFFVGHFDLRANEGQRWFTYSGSGLELPSAPNSNIPYDFKGTTKWMHGWLFTYNHEKYLSDSLTWFTNIGHSERAGNKWNSGAALDFDTNGNFTMNSITKNYANAQNEAGRNSYFQTGLKKNFQTGSVKHQASIAIDRSWAKYWNANNPESGKGPAGLIGGNIYDGTIFYPGFSIPPLKPAILQWTEINTGVTFADSLSYGKWNVLLAASHKHENFTNNAPKADAKLRKTENDDWLPTFGITYKASENLAFYAGQTESFARGQVVASKYTNAYETLSPSISKQKEIGIKYKFDNILTTLSYFDIDTENLIETIVGKTPEGQNLVHYGSDGRNRYKGVEWTINGKPADKWTVTGGLMYLNAKRDKTKNGADNGKFVNGVAKWSGVLGAVYEPNDKWSIIGRLNWVGEAFIDSKSTTSSTRIPAYTTLDLGFNYKTEVSDIPVTFTAMCYNALNNDYWMGRGGSTTFGLSMPRTFMLSASFDF